MSNETKLPAPPYVSFKTFLSFLDWLGVVGIPNRIDRSFWGEKFSGVSGNQLIATLKFFGLTNEKGIPDPMLEAMATDIPQRKVMLTTLMARYAEALDGLDLARATAGELDERFRRYDISGDTFRKAVVFFIQAAQYAELPLSPFVTKRKRPLRPSPGNEQPKRRGRPPKAREPQQTLPPPSRVTTGTPDIEGLGLHPSVNALLIDLNRLGSRWSKAERDRWVNTFLAIIDYAYPAMEHEV